MRVVAANLLTIGGPTEPLDSLVPRNAIWNPG